MLWKIRKLWWTDANVCAWDPRITYEIMKRLLDVIVSALVLLATSPVWLFVAILIRLDSRGSVLFVQQAVGRYGRKFALYKFRSMYPGSKGADHQKAVLEDLKHKKPAAYDRLGAPLYKTSLTDKRRITRVGKYLRRCSLDELPQLWNVLRGEMSLVGPRPALPYEAMLHTEQQRARFQVRPGITGLYQVTARNRVPIEEMIRIDLEYIQRRSLLYDLWIIVRTPRAMLRGV